LGCIRGGDLRGSMEATMRNNPMMLMGAAALLIIGGAAFQAQATMGGGTDFSARTKPYSLIEKASCSGQGLFCRSGSALSATLYALVCPAPLLRQQGITNIKGESGPTTVAQRGILKKSWSPIGAHIEFLARASN
jgi:hypothetical protein